MAGLLRRVGIRPHTILDEDGRETVMLLPLEDHLRLTPSIASQELKHMWYFHQTSQTQFGLDCCSTRR